MMKTLIRIILLLLLCVSSLKAQLKEFEISEMTRPDVSTVQANTAFPEDALIFVYSSFDNLSFRSSVGAVDKQYYNSRANRYEILVKPLKQMIFISASEFMEQKLATFNPKPKEDFYFKVEEKKTTQKNQTIPGKLTINSNPTGANISLNGIPVATKTPFIGNLNPGPTNIQLSKTKYQTFDTLLNIESAINEVLTINLKPSTLWLNIKSNPSSAKVELDGKIIGETPFSKELDLSDKSKQGERLLKLTLNDYAPVNQTIQLYPSIDPLAINVDMKKLEGAYKIESIPEGADVFIDGEYKGHTPLQGTLPIGTYSAQLKMEDYSPSSKRRIHSHSCRILIIKRSQKISLVMKKIISQFILLTILQSCNTYSDAEKNNFDTQIVQYLKAKNIRCDRSDSGLYYHIYDKGEGENIQLTDSVAFTYKGTLLNGTAFDNQKKPVTFKVKDLIAGWKEIMLKLKTKSKVLLVMPPLLGYGTHDLEKIPPNSILVFQMEINCIK